MCHQDWQSPSPCCPPGLPHCWQMRCPAQPSLPGSTASAVANTKSIWESWDFIAQGTEKYTEILGGQGYRQGRKVSLLGSQQLIHKSPTDAIHPWDTTTLQRCPELCPCTHSFRLPSDKHISAQSPRPQRCGLLSQQRGVLNPHALWPGKAAMEREDGSDPDSNRRSCICMQVTSWDFDKGFLKLGFSL